MQSRPGVIGAGRDRVSPCAVFDKNSAASIRRSCRVYECIINNILWILAPSALRIAERPRELAGLGLQATVGIEEALNQVDPTDPGRDAQVVDARASFEQKLDGTVCAERERILDGRPPPLPLIAAPALRRTGIASMLSMLAAAMSGSSTGAASIDQKLGHKGAMGPSFPSSTTHWSSVGWLFDDRSVASEGSSRDSPNVSDRRLDGSDGRMKLGSISAFSR